MKNKIEDQINKTEKEKSFLDTREVLEESRRLALIYPNANDMQKLLEWRNEKSFLDGCTHRDKEITMEEFQNELKADFEFDRHFQTIVYNKRKEEKIGTLWSYQYDKNENSVFISTYLDPENQGKSYGAEAFVNFMKYLIEKEDIEKFYTEVYSNNEISLKTMITGGFEVLGVDNSKERIKKNEKVEVLKLVFDKNNEEQMKKFDYILELFKKKEDNG